MHRGQRVAELVHRRRHRVLLRAQSAAEALDVPAKLVRRELERVSLGEEREPVARGPGDLFEAWEARA